MKGIKRKEQIIQYLKEQRGVASIVEYSIVLPLCLVAVMFLFLVAYFLNERAVLDAAAHRSVLVAEKLYFDPKFKVITDLDYVNMSEDYVGYKKKYTSFKDPALDGQIEAEQYRFFMGGSSFQKYAEQCVKQKALSCVANNQLFPLGDRVSDLQVETVEITTGPFKKVSITITEEYHMPNLVKLIGLDTDYKMQVSATTGLSAEPELIRNIDLVLEVMEDYNLDDYLEKFKSVLEKVSNFVTSLGEA